MKLIVGPNWTLEDQADRLLAQARRNASTPESTEYPTLNERQMLHRLEHEVFNETGFPETHIVSGVFGRVWNPDAGAHKSIHPVTY